MKQDKIIEKALKHYKIADEAFQKNRERMLEDLEFGRLGKQWDANIERQRRLENRPCLVINTMPAFIRQVVNDARQNKPSIKVYPVDDHADVQTAKILDGNIRHIEYTSKADIAYDTAIDHAASMGRGYLRVDIDRACYDSFDYDIFINRIANPLTVLPDPYSESADGSDWNICFITEMMPLEMFKKKYPNADISSFDGDGLNSDQRIWFETDSVRVGEYWVREKIKTKIYQLSDGTVRTEEDYSKNLDFYQVHGILPIKERETYTYEVTQYILNGVEILEENEWPGQYIPIIPVNGEEVNNNGRLELYSLIHHAKDAQRNKNYWRTAATELVALAPRAPWIGKKGTFDSDPNWDTANSVNHAYLEFDGDVMPIRQPFAGVPAGSIQEALNASDDVKAILGMYDASLGARSNETSGRAILARQREGDVSTFHFIDNLNRAIRQVGLVILDIIPHVYSERRIIRIMGEDGTPSAIPIGSPVVVDETGVRPANDNEQDISRIFDLSLGKYDVVVSAGASYTTRRIEAAEQMMELIRTMPDTATLISDLLAKNLDWPGADEIAERLKSVNPYIQNKKAEQDPSLQAEMSQKKMLEMQNAVSEVRVKNAEAAVKEADAMLKTQQAQTPIPDGRGELMRVALQKQQQEQQYILKLKEIEANLVSQREKLIADLEKTAMESQTSLEIAQIESQRDIVSNAETEVNDKCNIVPVGTPQTIIASQMNNPLIDKINDLESRIKTKIAKVNRDENQLITTIEIEGVIEDSPEKIVSDRLAGIEQRLKSKRKQNKKEVPQG
jgi:hypothetical protein